MEVRVLKVVTFDGSSTAMAQPHRSASAEKDAPSRSEPSRFGQPTSC